MLLDKDIAFLRATGRDQAQVEAALERLGRGPRHRRLQGACTVGSGIFRYFDAERAVYAIRHDQAAGEGRVSAFVPASGAATRMFGNIEGRTDVLSHATDLALWDSLGIARTASPPEVAEAIRTHYSQTPKALVPFHKHGSDIRTALEDHLVEAAQLVRSRDQKVRVVFTASPEHAATMEKAALKAAYAHGKRLGVTFEVQILKQDPATDTPALFDGRPARDPHGRLLLRPGGHGALLPTLNALHGDIIVVKNIDNIVPDNRRGQVLRWRATLSGLAVMVSGLAQDLIRRLESKGTDTIVSEGVAFSTMWFGIRPEADRDAVIDALDRPLRVCGMVPNDGQPGGGPFRIEGSRGIQIVEAAEIDRNDPHQAAIFASATHFNPVDMALAVRDHRGRPYDLLRYADPNAGIVTKKQQDGKDLLVYEHPGLWNGGMAHWNTVFLEIARDVFQPVKELGDLLGQGHRG